MSPSIHGKNSIQAETAVETFCCSWSFSIVCVCRKNSIQAEAAVETIRQSPNTFLRNHAGKNSIQAEAAVETINVAKIVCFIKPPVKTQYKPKRLLRRPINLFLKFSNERSRRKNNASRSGCFYYGTSQDKIAIPVLRKTQLDIQRN